MRFMLIKGGGRCIVGTGWPAGSMGAGRTGLHTDTKTHARAMEEVKL